MFRVHENVHLKKEACSWMITCKWFWLYKLLYSRNVIGHVLSKGVILGTFPTIIWVSMSQFLEVFGSRSPPFSNFENVNHTNWKKSSMQVSICAKIVSSGLSALPNQRKMNQFLEPLLWTNFLATLTGLEYLEEKVSWRKKPFWNKICFNKLHLSLSLSRQGNLIRINPIFPSLLDQWSYPALPSDQ